MFAVRLAQAGGPTQGTGGAGGYAQAASDPTRGASLSSSSVIKSIQHVDCTSFLHFVRSFSLFGFFAGRIEGGGGVLQGPAIVRRHVPALTGSSGALAKIDHRNFW